MAEAKVKLLVVQGRPAGKVLFFPPGEFLFGRGAECHVRPQSAWVSRQHCLLRVTDAGASIRDLGSCHGTLVNGQLLVQERRLVPGDEVQIGPLVFEMQPHDGTGFRPPEAADRIPAGAGCAEPADYSI